VLGSRMIVWLASTRERCQFYFLTATLTRMKTGGTETIRGKLGPECPDAARYPL
jgi:hypothetical protein